MKKNKKTKKGKIKKEKILRRRKKLSSKSKLIILLMILVLLIFEIRNIIQIKLINQSFAEEISEFYTLNSKTVFSIDKIYMYSSANAISNNVTRPIWDLDIYQFTDIAIYINNDKSNSDLTYENSIKSLYIDNIKINDLKLGEASLYYKNIMNFGKSLYEENDNNVEATKQNKISDRIDFSIINDGDADYSKKEIYTDCTNPITLEYINDIKKNQVISDIKNDLTYNGALLRKSGIILSDIECGISFRINLVNNYNQKFIANVYLPISLEDTITGENIYSGKFVKEINESNYIKFFRVN